MAKIEGFWDCTYCGNREIRGSVRICPGCGKTRAADVKFYMKGTTPVADESKVEAGPDWFCPYCDSYNPSSARFCTNCGHPREEEDKDYFEVREEQAQKQEEQEAELASVTGQGTQTVTRSRPGAGRYVVLILILALLLTGIYSLMPRDRGVTVAEKAWTRTVEVEENRLVEEDGWSVPQDAVEVLRSQREIHHYNQVLDHYETVPVTRSEQVLDGYDTYTTYEDMGNGYFESVEHQTPRYRTEYYTEYIQEPVYRSVPVYETKYYYTAYRWMYDRTERASGGAEEPYWPELPQGDTFRPGDRTEQYTVTCQNKKGERTEYICGLDIWNMLDVGRAYTVTTQSGRITDVKTP